MIMSNKEKIRQYKLDSMNPILKDGYFLYVERTCEPVNKYEIHYFDAENKLRDYLAARFASSTGRSLHEHYREKLINGDEVRAMLYHDGEAYLHKLKVFHGETVTEVFSVLRMFLIPASNAMKAVRTTEEMQALIREYNDILNDPPEIRTIYSD